MSQLAKTPLNTMLEEIVETILHTMEQQDLYSLLRCSRSLYSLILPYLHRSMTLYEVRHRISTHSSQGHRVNRQRYSFNHLYELLRNLLRRPTLASHVKRITTNERMLAHVTLRRDDREPIAVSDLDDNVHRLIRRVSNSGSDYKRLIKDITQDRNGEASLALLFALLPCLSYLSMHFCPHFVTTLSHVLNKKTAMPWRTCGSVKHLDHQMTQFCDCNCKSAFPHSLLPQLPSLESISGSPHETEAVQTLRWKIDKSRLVSLCKITSISLNCTSQFMSWIPVLMRVFRPKTLELKLFRHGLQGGKDRMESLRDAMPHLAPTIEKLRLEQDMQTLVEKNEYYYDAHRSLNRLSPFNHFLWLTSLRLSMVFIFGMRNDGFYRSWNDNISSVQEPLDPKAFEYLRESIANLLPLNIEHLSIFRHVGEVVTPLLMSVEHTLSVAPARFVRLKTISMEARYGNVERDRREGKSRAGLGQYERPEAIAELEVQGQKQGINVTWDDDWSRENLVIR